MQSRPDFINKMSVALKEANETLYWLELLNDSLMLKKETSDLLNTNCKELVAMLVATVKTSKNNL